MNAYVSSGQLPATKSRWSLRFSERRFLLLIVDLLILNVSLYLSLLIQGRLGTPIYSEFRILSWFALISLLWFIFATIFDCYDLRKSSKAGWVLLPILVATLLTSFTNLLIPFISPPLPNRRLFIMLLPVLATVGLIGWRMLYAYVFSRAEFARRILIVGAGHSTLELLKAIPSRSEKSLLNSRLGEMGYQLLGFVDDDPRKRQLIFEDVPVLGTTSNLDSLIVDLKPDDLVIAVRDESSINNSAFESILNCHEHGVNITRMINLYANLTGRIPVGYIGQNLHIVLPMQRPASFRLYLLVRRAIDFVGGIIGTLILGLVTPFVWLGNRLTDPGDIFYRQERVGEGGRTFDVIKFRSMVMDAEKFSGAVWAEENDPRITKLGRFMRKTRIDEIPQFWNVLKGEMSLVGPRPERPHFVDQLAEGIPYYRARHATKPGITGWAQVNYKYGSSVADSQAKLEYDLYYIKNQGLLIDIQTLLKTVQVILGMKGQ